MSQTSHYYIGSLKLDVINDAYLVEVSFVDTPPRQDKLKDLPDWTLKSKNAVWLVQGNLPMLSRARDGDKIKESLHSFLQ